MLLMKLGQYDLAVAGGFFGFFQYANPKWTIDNRQSRSPTRDREVVLTSSHPC
jgi:hypothetical protein